ncbi:DUF3307 domain-containing protein [Nonomuraea sp. NPDC023979]|uniref:DUF3307 domain-containing protein n=1 Tax=Nonomuraea sp. NPDC023979 TaxID=3154796 RepID=UPI0033CDF8D4
MSRTATFAATLAALYAAHEVGDHWVQTHTQACTKGGRGDQQRAGQLACARHVATLTATKAAVLAITAVVTKTRLPLGRTLLALGLDATSHYAIDRRWTLAAFADRTGKASFYQLGQPRPGRDDNPSLGTGAYALDQAAHTACLWVAALIIASGQELLPDGTT